MNAVSTLTAVALWLLLACSPTTAAAARDEVWDVEEEVLAQMARMKVRKHTDNQARSGLSQLSKEAGGSNTGCGNLNVGNVRGNPRGGDQNVTVIVTGNVINANNRCPR
jgi:uncharacterized protein YjcR